MELQIYLIQYMENVYYITYLENQGTLKNHQTNMSFSQRVQRHFQIQINVAFWVTVINSHQSSNSKKETWGTRVSPAVSCLNEIRCCPSIFRTKLLTALPSRNSPSGQYSLELSLCFVPQKFLHPEAIHYIKTRFTLGRVKEHAFGLEYKGNRKSELEDSTKQKCSQVDQF